MKLQEIYDRFVMGYSDPAMRNYLNFLTYLVSVFGPRHVLELGTATGASARMMMQCLPRESKLTTIGSPGSGDKLVPWLGDKRLTCITGAVLSPDVRQEVYGEVDFLFMNDVQIECWDLWSSILVDGSVVCVNGWISTIADNYSDSVDASLCSASGFGVFRYRRPR